ncbi:hypothetical protein [Glycomyces tenuis]|uniref:hypothetical protein n=1 Tax=Glycomyces tenuis TaxID=58116 RepID=UPI0004016E38|nr:hypothetical protein [Glycomyces tenuis]
MAHPENQQQEDDDGGTFKLKPGAQSKPEAPQGEESLDSTMKLRKAGGASVPPPPPPSPLGNPTGPSNPQPSPFAETSVMPQSGGSQTGFQPATQPPGQSNPLGQPTPPPQQQAQQQYGQQPYGQQPPPGGQYPPQQGHMPPAQQSGPGGAPKALQRVGMLAMISGVAGIVWALLGFFTGEFGLIVNAVVYLVTSAVVLGISFALPRGVLKSKRWRQYAVGIFGAHGLIGLMWMLGSMTSSTPAWFLAAGWLLIAIVVGAVAYGIFLILKDPEIRNWFEGAPASIHHTAGGAVPPPTAPGQPGSYPPPPGYPQQGQPGQQPPYGR